MRNGSVPQEFLDVLGVDVTEKQERGARVPEVVEPVSRASRALEPGLAGAERGLLAVGYLELVEDV